MRVLWLSDSPTVPSGFGNVTRFVCEGLTRAGHDVHILGWQCTGPSREWRGATLHGIGWHPLGADVLLSYLYRLRPDVLVTLGDVWWLTFVAHPSIQQFFAMTGMRWLMYFPIDGNLPDGTLPSSWVDMLHRCDVPVAMSQYGRRVAQSCGVACEYIPHGVETNTFRPAERRDNAKRELGYTGRFIVLSDARNQPRKMLPRLLSVFERFARGKPDVLLHLHCDPDDPSTAESRYSYRIAEDVRALDLEEKVRFTQAFSIGRGLTLEHLVEIYQSADVHLLVSGGEGFGLPTLQAAACGVVPAAPDYSANRELVDGHGLLLPVAEYVPDEFGISRAFVDLSASARLLEQLYHDRPRLEQCAARARRFAEDYDWARVIPQWEALLRRHAALPRAQVSASRGAHDLLASFIAGDARRVEITQTGARRVDPVAAGMGAQLKSALAGSLHTLPGGASVTIRMSEQMVGELTRQLYTDTREESGSPRLHIPIARTEREHKEELPRVRTVGSVCVEATGDLEGNSADLAERLRQLLPVLAPWSRGSLRSNSHAWFRALSRSILAIDLDGLYPELPLWTAYLGVPTIGPRNNAFQRMCWPELSVDASHGGSLRLARDVLTDYVATVTLVAEAAHAFARRAGSEFKLGVAEMEAASALDEARRGAWSPLQAVGV